MTKTHAELLPCPFCGGQPVHEGGRVGGDPSEPEEYYENIFCSNPSCTPFECSESWNNRVNKEAKFLEELEDLINLHHDYVPAFKIIELIEQFDQDNKHEDSK